MSILYVFNKVKTSLNFIFPFSISKILKRERQKKFNICIGLIGVLYLVNFQFLLQVQPVERMNVKKI